MCKIDLNKLKSNEGAAEKKQKEAEKMEKPPSQPQKQQPIYLRPDPMSPPQKRPRFYDFGDFVISSPGSDSTITEDANGSLDVNITNENDVEMAGISERLQIDQQHLARYVKVYQIFQRENFKGFDTGDVKIKSLYYDSNKESNEITDKNKDYFLGGAFKKDDQKEPLSVVWCEEDLKTVLLFHDR